MKTREEVERMLTEEVDLRKKEFVMAFKNGYNIDGNLDNIRNNNIWLLCQILGNASYNAVTHDLQLQPALPAVPQSQTYEVKGSDTSLSISSSSGELSEPDDTEFEQIRTCAVAKKKH